MDANGAATQGLTISEDKNPIITYNKKLEPLLYILMGDVCILPQKQHHGPSLPLRSAD